MMRLLQRLMHRPISTFVCLAFIVAACSTPVATFDSTSQPTPKVMLTSTLSPPASPTMIQVTRSPQPTHTATVSAYSPTPTPEVEFHLCSPLAGYTLADLPAIVSNLYFPPAPGSDDPHQGVDLADRLPDSGIAIAGMPVQAVLAGKVVLVQPDRFPYGSAVMVETELQALPLLLRDQMPAAGPLWSPNLALSCPQVPQPDASSPSRSVYVLYAHLLDAPTLHPGDWVECGNVIGAMGQSGNALAPHLHLEIRLGPSGWQPFSLSHYSNNAAPDEMGQYCTWRVSGIFQHLDPLRWFESISNP